MGLYLHVHKLDLQCAQRPRKMMGLHIRVPMTVSVQASQIPAMLAMRQQVPDKYLCIYVFMYLYMCICIYIYFYACQQFLHFYIYTYLRLYVSAFGPQLSGGAGPGPGEGAGSRSKIGSQGPGAHRVRVSKGRTGPTGLIWAQIWMWQWNMKSKKRDFQKTKVTKYDVRIYVPTYPHI